MAVDVAWLRKRYVDDVADVFDIAAEAGCSVPNIRRVLKKHGIRRGKVFLIGGKAWNSGLTKNDDERLARLSAERTGDGNPMRGKRAWNTGATKETDERLRRLSEVMSSRVVSKETRERQRLAKLGKFGEESNRWAGGVGEVGGYGFVCERGRRIYAHRALAEKILGRNLERLEQVHHIDLNRKNNIPSNLIVLLSGDHQALHAAIRRGATSKAQQISWLIERGCNFEVLQNED